MQLEDVLSHENAAIALVSADYSSPEARAKLKPALETLAASLEALEPLMAADFVSHLNQLKAVPSFYGEIPPLPKKPRNPYGAAQASGDLPTHDSVTEYEDEMMFYRNECRTATKALAAACREFSSRL